MYDYRILEIVNVVDGDTLDVRISLGFGLSATLRFRLANIDTPEIFGRNAVPAGAEAKAFTVSWLAANAPLGVRTFKGSQAATGIGDGSFGRYLGEVYCIPTQELLSDALRAAGFGAGA